MNWISLAFKAGPWIVAALAIGFGLFERSGWSEEKAARAADLWPPSRRSARPRSPTPHTPARSRTHTQPRSPS